MINKNNGKLNKFIIVTEENSGAGYAKRFIDEGNEVIIAGKAREDLYKTVKDKILFNLTCKGIVPRIDFDKIFKDRKKYKDWAWIFDQNHNSDYADQLRKEGFQYIFGTSSLTDKMEHNRGFGVSLIKKAGLQTPPTYRFNSIQDGINFLEQNEDKAYIFKPDDNDNESWSTTVPDNERNDKANKEIGELLQSFGNGKGSYILQERKKGIELNVEIFVYKGQAFFAHANFESKKKLNKDLGKFVGCSQDIDFVIPLESKIIQETVIKLLKLPEFKDYTGFLDMNIIVSDKQYWFLEFCARFGYNMHINLFWNLSILSISEIFSKYLTGDINNFYQYFRDGFGATITLYTDNPVKGVPITVPEELDENFYYFSIYKDNGMLKISGETGIEVGVLCSMDYDIKSAADNVLDLIPKINYPNKSARTDIDKTDYLSNPIERYIACQAMKLFDKK